MNLTKFFFYPWIQDLSSIHSKCDEWAHCKVRLLNTEGQPEKYQAGDGSWQEKIFATAHHVESGDLYINDSVTVVAIKSITLIAVNPIYMSARAIFFTAKIIADLFACAILSSIELFVTSQEQSYLDAFYQIYQAHVRFLPEQIACDVVEIISTIWFGIGSELAVVYGALYDPYAGRSIYAQIEKKINHDLSCRNSLYHFSFEKISHCFLHGNSVRNSFYSAPCMQKKGNINDVHSNDNHKYEILGGIENIDLKEFVPCLPLIP